jgi:hypothetical protein
LQEADVSEYHICAKLVLEPILVLTLESFHPKYFPNICISDPPVAIRSSMDEKFREV